MTNIVQLPPRASRLSEKLRRAIDMRVTMGMSVVDACEKAGISTAGYHKAQKRPAVLDYVQAVQHKFVADSGQMRAHARVLAIAVAVDLMTNSKDEKIRARMSEFLAGDGKAPAVQVSIDARQALPAANYTFVRPASMGGTLEGE